MKFNRETGMLNLVGLFRAVSPDRVWGTFLVSSGCEAVPIETSEKVRGRPTSATDRAVAPVMV